MAKSVGIALTATGISFASDWYHSNTPNFRILMAGMGATVIIDAIEKLNPKAGVGLAVIFLITVLVTPPKQGNSPVGTLSQIANSLSTPKKKVILT